MRSLLLVLLTCLSGCSIFAPASPLRSLVADYEAGPLGVIRNDGRYGEDGTLYRKQDVNQGRTLAFAQRLSLELRPAEKHGFTLLYAPLQLDTRARLGRDLRFRDEIFAAASTVDHRYVFDAYRATYAYRALSLSRFRLDLGGSLQVRSASVSFTDVAAGRYALESDIGLVPALRVSARYEFPWRLYAQLDVDALDTFGILRDVNGGLYDAAFSLGIPLREDTTFFMRVRYLGGSEDVPARDLYTRAHFLSASIGFRADLIALLN